MKTIAYLSLIIMALIPDIASGQDIQIRRDIVYLGESRKEKLDAYLPPAEVARPVPAIIMIHGGGWSSGNRAGNREKSVAKTLAQNGYAVFSISYALNKREKNEKGKQVFTEIAWPQNLADCKSALRFVRKEAEKFGVDKNRIAALGFSAGGHLAMLLGVTANEESLNSLGLYTEESNVVSCIVNFYGRHDLTTGREAHFRGADDDETAANVKTASPVTYFRKDMPPVLILHGTKDDTVPVTIGREIHRHLDELGVENEYVEVEGGVHSFNLEPPQKDLRPVVLEFLKKHL